MRKPRAPRRGPAVKPAATPAPAGLARAPRATLIFFAAVGLLLWGRLLLKEVPQTASAVDPEPAARAAAHAADGHVSAPAADAAPPPDHLERKNQAPGDKVSP